METIEEIANEMAEHKFGGKHACEYAQRVREAHNKRVEELQDEIERLKKEMAGGLVDFVIKKRSPDGHWSYFPDRLWSIKEARHWLHERRKGHPNAKIRLMRRFIREELVEEVN